MSVALSLDDLEHHLAELAATSADGNALGFCTAVDNLLAAWPSMPTEGRDELLQRRRDAATVAALEAMTARRRA